MLRILRSPYIHFRCERRPGLHPAIMNMKLVFSLLACLALTSFRATARDLRPAADEPNAIAQPIDSVYGYAFRDFDGDCQRDSFETEGYEGWPVYLYVYTTGAVVFKDTTYTGPGGFYLFDDLPNVTGGMGANLIILGPPPGSGLQCHFTGCPLEEVFTFPLNANTYRSNIGFQCDSLPPCPRMVVDIATSIIRPCSTSYYNVQYCNDGLLPAEDAYVDVTFDAGLTVTTSTIPWTTVNGNTYTFPLGDLASGQCGSFNVSVLADCDAPLGTTYCVEAHAYPDTCLPPAGIDWDGSEIRITSECTGDSTLFVVENAGSGNMQSPLEYIVIEDNVLLKPMPGVFQLAAGASMTLAYPADGSFRRVEAEQSPGFPGLRQPAAWSEGCGTSATPNLGFTNQYPLGDEDPWLDVFCTVSANSHDPNDKQGFPLGYDAAHYIEQNTGLEYLIRFQNTGTAPAYAVEIRDTLPVQWLDPTTVRPGASSHPYTWDMQGNGVVVFRFPGIVLPDSTANYEASQGFVKFNVAQRKDVPLGTEIRNTAAIYFDFNPPVITNQTLHTIGKDFVVVGTNTPLLPGWEVQIAPNPASARVQLRVENPAGTYGKMQFRLTNVQGMQVLNGAFEGPVFEFQAADLPQGMYFYEVSNNGTPVAAGKLVRTGF